MKISKHLLHEMYKAIATVIIDARIEFEQHGYNDGRLRRPRIFGIA